VHVHIVERGAAIGGIGEPRASPAHAESFERVKMLAKTMI
jgi:hypothetical protein